MPAARQTMEPETIPNASRSVDELRVLFKEITTIPIAEPSETFEFLPNDLSDEEDPYATPEFRDLLVRHFTTARNKAIAENAARPS